MGLDWVLKTGSTTDNSAPATDLEVADLYFSGFERVEILLEHADELRRRFEASGCAKRNASADDFVHDHTSPVHYCQRFLSTGRNDDVYRVQQQK